jgi:hypothetical protein
MNNKQQPIKFRNRYSLTDIFYTFPNWDTKDIDGVCFQPVLKDLNSKKIFYVRKDSLEKIK